MEQLKFNSDIFWNYEDEQKIFDNADVGLIKRFREFHAQNGWVYTQFLDQANKAVHLKGFKKLSGWFIMNIIRWEVGATTAGDVFKLNNDFIALYVRLLIYHHEYFKPFFELRGMKKNRRQISDAQKERELIKGDLDG